jgi:hypothetical protein
MLIKISFSTTFHATLFTFERFQFFMNNHDMLIQIPFTTKGHFTLITLKVFHDDDDAPAFKRRLSWI